MREMFPLLNAAICRMKLLVAEMLVLSTVDVQRGPAHCAKAYSIAQALCKYRQSEFPRASSGKGSEGQA